MTQPASPLAVEFVQTCLRARIDPAALAAARAIAQRAGFDWDEAVEAAREHIVAPILYSILRDEEGLPDGALQKLRATYIYTGRRNRALFAELALVLRELEAAGLRPILLGGAALAASVYGDPALRQLRDLDIFIEAERLAAVMRALAELGYQPVNAEVRGEAVIAYEGEVALRKSDIVETILELHTTVLPSPAGGPPVPTLWFRETAVKRSIGPAWAPTLAPEAQIVYLCGHAWARHAEGGLLWLHDIAEAVRHWRDSLDWEQALEFALQHDLRLPVGESLARIAEGWGAPVPPEVLSRLTHSATEEAEQAARRRPGPLRRLWADLAMRPAGGERAAVVWRTLFPSLAYMQRRYRVAYPLLLPLYYLLRWLEGLRRLFSAR